MPRHPTAKPRDGESPQGGPSPGRKSDERRRHRRVAAAPLRVDTPGASAGCTLVDLSESGVRLRCDRAIPAMTKIQVHMTLPGPRLGLESDVRVEAGGVVVWSHRLNGTAFDTGVFFAEIDDRQRALLRAYVDSHA